MLDWQLARQHRASASPLQGSNDEPHDGWLIASKQAAHARSGKQRARQQLAGERTSACSRCLPAWKQ